MSHPSIQKQGVVPLSYWLFQFGCALLWTFLALANTYSSQNNLLSVCFIPAGLTMGLMLSYGSQALPAILLGGFVTALIATITQLPNLAWGPIFIVYSACYALGHALVYLVVSQSVRQLCGGYIRLEQPSHVFYVLYGCLVASALTSLITTLVHMAEVTLPFAQLTAIFLRRWMGALTGALCFALSFTALLAFLRCERLFNRCHLDTHHLRRGLNLDRGIVCLTLIYAVVILGLDWLGQYIGESQFIATCMGIVTLFALAWAAVKLSYGAVALLVAIFSTVQLITLSAFWASFHVADVQILLPSLAIAGTLIWSLSSTQSCNQALHLLANTDELTGLANRRQWVQLAQKEFLRCQRHQESLCIVLIDIDHFKEVNDTYGHLTGDLALQHIAQVMESQQRRESTLCRFGGEEFALLLPSCNLEQAHLAAERIRRKLQNTPLVQGSLTIALTASLGVASQRSDDVRLETVIARADDALYQAKTNGRNQVFPGVEDL